MTRKRFVKLLISNGKSRNEAMNIALQYNDCGFSYKKAYLNYTIKYALSDAFKKLGKSFSKASKSIVELSNALSKFKTI